ncbi:MAG: hypothetical protein OEZ34_08915, partial [Spirochaetia bacterium]|nr:hypothetical protein [Spirochaetia bacterium]
MIYGNEFANSFYSLLIFFVQFFGILAVFLIWILPRLRKSRLMQKFSLRLPSSLHFPVFFGSFLIFLFAALSFSIFLSPLTPTSLGKRRAVYLISKDNQQRLSFYLTHVGKGKTGATMWTRTSMLLSEPGGKRQSLKTFVNFGASDYRLAGREGRYFLVFTPQGLCAFDLWENKFVRCEKELLSGVTEYKLKKNGPGKFAALTPEGRKIPLVFLTQQEQGEYTVRDLAGPAFCSTNPRK